MIKKASVLLIAVSILCMAPMQINAQETEQKINSAIGINASIQQYVNGRWTTIKSWTSTSYNNSGYLDQTWYVTSGYYYRMVSTGAVYQNDKLVEQTSYTSPSYWY
ncbi:MAG: hypothetical protein M0T74_02590 [Desulfitobacterium hafniense]|nr:hypothetical protein [Desulfitobacterium hafniense]